MLIILGRSACFSPVDFSDSIVLELLPLHASDNVLLVLNHLKTNVTVFALYFTLRALSVPSPTYAHPRSPWNTGTSLATVPVGGADTHFHAVPYARVHASQPAHLSCHTQRHSSVLWGRRHTRLLAWPRTSAFPTRSPTSAVWAAVQRGAECTLQRNLRFALPLKGTPPPRLQKRTPGPLYQGQKVTAAN